ncbi:hypothetical protein PIIN_03876 [Serendipita indica DSM 11827]|uniref:UspA domain-containing protein n=1 Tax=Serendipita indica (strain DSM 11827) TaxID=1109443 RepID=G4TF37_SERID|nr:hypothetical protein PIIN_03876 [Serendipita indica DSM 11827]
MHHLPTPPLRSAMRHSSRPSSPSPSPVPLGSPPTSTSGLITSPQITQSQLPPSTTSYGLASPPTSYGKLPRAVTSSSLGTPAGYTPKVSFDTFENPMDDALFSFTLQVKSEGYKRTRRTRVFLCAASPDESGMEALDWALESLCQDDDEFIVVRGFDTGELDKDHDTLREEARDLMKMIGQKNVEYDPDRKLSIVVEFVASKITETIERMIALYRPDSLIVGTRGEKSFLQQVGQAVGSRVGSVSRYCLSHSPVPVIVVSPHRRRTMEKRRADPKRKTQYEELTQAKHHGHHGHPIHQTVSATL